MWQLDVATSVWKFSKHDSQPKGNEWCDPVSNVSWPRLCMYITYYAVPISSAQDRELCTWRFHLLYHIVKFDLLCVKRTRMKDIDLFWKSVRLASEILPLPIARQFAYYRMSGPVTIQFHVIHHQLYGTPSNVTELYTYISILVLSTVMRTLYA